MKNDAFGAGIRVEDSGGAASEQFDYAAYRSSRAAFDSAILTKCR